MKAKLYQVENGHYKYTFDTKSIEYTNYCPGVGNIFADKTASHIKVGIINMITKFIPYNPPS